MATVEFESGRAYHEPPATFSEAGPRRALFAAIRWSAVIAGMAVGISIQLAIALLGIASGIAALDIMRADSADWGPHVWVGLSAVVASFVGAYVAARMSNLKRSADGILHGVVTWAITTLLLAVLSAPAGGSLLGGMIGNNAASGSAASNALLASQLGNNVNPGALQAVQQHIQAGRRPEAVELIVENWGIDQPRAEALADQALRLAAADPAGRVTASARSAAWAIFLTTVLSLLSAMLGGAYGVASARRPAWSTEARLAGPQPAESSGRTS